MAPFSVAHQTHQLVLEAETAADLMTTHPVSIREDASLQEAANLLTERDVSALPVLDETGHPVGVLSRTDFVRNFRQKGGEHLRSSIWSGSATGAKVRDIMTHAFLAVPVTTTALEVVAQILGLGNVHQLFVVDESRSLVGVISARDILRRLRRLEVA